MTIWKMIFCCLFLLISVQAIAQPAPQNKDEGPIYLKQKMLARDPQTKVETISPLTTLQATVKGTFWRNPDWVKVLDLSSDQQRKMDDVFQQYRLKLIDLTASLQKEELVLEPLFGRERPTPEAEGKILVQIDRIADARAELEKANSRMLVGILQVLTSDQWNKLPIPSKKYFLTKPLK
jgi:hypothetical protein